MRTILSTLALAVALVVVLALAGPPPHLPPVYGGDAGGVGPLRHDLDAGARRDAESCQSVDPSWSPDGRRILFVSNCDAENLEIYRMERDGSHRVRLTSTPGDEHTPVFSPDGSRIVYAYRQDGEAPELRTMAADGSDVRPVTGGSLPGGSPTWSPDGRRIAFERTSDGNADIWMVDVESGEETRLTDDPARDVAPRWSPDGSTIAFQSSRAGQYDIYGVDPASGEERRLVDLPGDAVTPSWAPDSRRLAFAYYEGEVGDIWTASLDGADPVQITDSERTDFWPSWSPDGRSVAFISKAAEADWDVWVMDAGGSNQRRLTRGALDPGAETGEASPEGPDRASPRVAILIYDGVQIIDHTAPWEVLGQYSLNDVYSVAEEEGPVTTFMGMRVLPSYTFEDAPPADVLVVPGGDTRDAQRDPEIVSWIRERAAGSPHVLGICSGVMLLEKAGLLDGRRVTTYYDLLDVLRERNPDVTVVEDQLVVEDGKFVTTTGTGIEGALRVLERLHGPGWVRVVELNLERQPLPPEQRTPRASLADMNLPSSIYQRFPWREAELVRYEGDTRRWDMVWRFRSDGTRDLAARLEEGLREEGWSLTREGTREGRWRSVWSLRGRDRTTWRGVVELGPAPGDRAELAISVRSETP